MDKQREEKDITIKAKVIRWKEKLPDDCETYRVIWLHDYPNRYLLIPRDALK